jgi:hypothetical protein
MLLSRVGMACFSEKIFLNLVRRQFIALIVSRLNNRKPLFII